MAHAILLEEANFERNYTAKIKRWKIWTLVLCIGMLIAAVSINSAIALQDISRLQYSLSATIAGNAANIDKKMIPVQQEGILLGTTPEHVRHAFVAVEDKRFYQHDGIDVKAIARAAITDMKAGRIVEGGSTITQQLAKNIFLTNDRTWSRKWKEYLYAKKIERTYSKDQILNMYMNNIYYGNGSYGIKSAAQNYFGKEVEQLTIAEGAMLASIIKGPSYYSPTNNLEKAIERRNLTLRLMHEQGYITSQEYEQAVAEKVMLKK
jgi:membrane peptidoglycan carboxypeptidase